MASEEVVLQKKKELEAEQERTEAGTFYSPYTDVYESADAVVVEMDMPGVERSAVDVRVEDNQLTITGNIDSEKYQGLEPIYTEYNVGNFTRSFTLSTKIEAGAISAKMADGVLTVQLPKAKEAVAKRIEVA